MNSLGQFFVALNLFRLHISSQRLLASELPVGYAPKNRPSRIEQAFIDSDGGNTRLFEIDKGIRRIRGGLICQGLIESEQGKANQVPAVDQISEGPC
jgi:hypothetical protein